MYGRNKAVSAKIYLYHLRGLVKFPSNASEVIRCTIAALIQNSDLAPSLDAKKYGPNDLEFVKRTGHTFIVPEFAPDFHLDSSALKDPYRTGRCLCKANGEA